MTGIWTMGEMLVEIMRPKAGMLLNETGEFLGPYPSGAPAIFIDTVARLGHSAGIISGVADDEFGYCLLERLSLDGVDVRFVKKIPNKATAVAFVNYFEDGSRRFIYHIDGTPAVMARFYDSAAEGNPAIFHVMGCSLMANEQFRMEIIKAVERFHASGARISFDPNIRVELLGTRNLLDVIGPVLSRSAVIFPGMSELGLLTGNLQPEKSVKMLFENPSLEMIVLKRGKEGATVFTREESVNISPYEIQEVDPTGAGDCFDAGFLCGLVEGKSLEVCGKIAAAAGALNAAAFGPMEGKISPSSINVLLNLK